MTNEFIHYEKISRGTKPIEGQTEEVSVEEVLSRKRKKIENHSTEISHKKSAVKSTALFVKAYFTCSVKQG